MQGKITPIQGAIPCGRTVVMGQKDKRKEKIEGISPANPPRIDLPKSACPTRLLRNRRKERRIGKEA